MVKLPVKLREIVEEHYDGSLEQMVSAAQKCSKELYKLQGKFEEKNISVPRPYNLKSYWSEQQRKELAFLAEGLLDSSEDKNIAEIVQRSVLFKKENDLYGVPYTPKVKDAVPALAGGSLVRMVGRFLPAPYGLVVTILGVGVGGGRELWQRRVKNPFQQLGDTFVKKAGQYGSCRKESRGEGLRELESDEDAPREERRGYWGK
ncbi:hypothetical protein HYX13_02135 [Candidatus Woesearchaeota archaeon]|nr:hypothetical protein [Candidatus Woesearchaeota archaeon]